MKPWEINSEKDTDVSSPEQLSGRPWESIKDTTKVKEPTSGLGDMSSMSLVGALKGETQKETPFTIPTDTPEPIMNLSEQRNIQGSLNQEDIDVMEQKRKADEARANTEALYNRYSTLGNSLISFASPEARIKVEEGNKLVRDKVLEEIRAQGIPVDYRDGKIFTVDNDGKEIEVEDVSLLKSLNKSKFEMFGAITAGAVAGMQTGSRMPTLPGKIIGTVGGGLIGSAAGAYSGAALDGMLAKLQMASKVDDSVIYDKMKDAGVADLVMGPVGLGIGKAVVGAGKLTSNIFDFVYNKNQAGAVDAMLKHMGVDEVEAKQRVQDLENLIGPLRGMNDKEKIIYALTQTQRGGEAVAKAAVDLDPLASTRLANQVSKRAEDTLNLAEDLSTDNNQYIFRQSMDSYTNDVKANYRLVKDSSTEFTENYRFNLDDLNLNDTIDNIENSIANPFTKQKFSDISKVIKDSYEGSTFEDLIDLRQAINDVKFNGPKLKKEDSVAIENIMARVNKEIEDAAKTHIPNSDVWLNKWSQSLEEYTKMKQVMGNVMYKALTKPGISEDAVVNVFSKYIKAGDNTFFDVMSKLPPKVQNRVEGSVLNKLVNQYADGIEGSRRVIHFPGLSEELKKVSWQSPESKQLVRTINRMADVFKNDVHLAAVSGKIQLPRFQSYLTADPVIRLKMETASHFFNAVKQYMPTQSADTLAMANHLGRLLENPISNKDVKDLLGRIPMERRQFRSKLSETTMNDLNELRQAYVARKIATEQMFKKDIPPRLVWSADPDKLAKLQNPDARILPTVDEVLKVSSKGNVGKSMDEIWDYESQQILNTRASDLITEFIWKNSDKNSSIITEQAIKYMDESRYTGIMKNVSSKLSKEDFEYNAKVVANSIKSEAGILIKRIQKDFGLILPRDEAEKLVTLKFKEIMESCNGK